MTTLSNTPKPPFDLLFDPGALNTFPFETCLDYGFFPMYISDTKIGVYTHTNAFHKDYIKTKFPTHTIEVNRVSEWQFFQLLFMPFGSRYTELILHPLLLMGIVKGASDVHMFSKEDDSYFCQFRINGRLKTQTFENPENINIGQLIKLHSHMKINEFHQPQDGHIVLNVDKKNYPVRVSCIPSYHGDDFVFRLFKKDHNLCINSLGFTDKIVTQIKSLLNKKSGLFLVTGPTGSGKSTTLYSILNALKADITKNIVTLEDPIEYPLPGIRQSQINPNTNYTFSKGLRAILRQDPDIIMIGEIRDAETAKIAIEAAYTGHLVLATLHTEKCIDSLLRLSSFSIDPFFLTYSLVGILSQKLDRDDQVQVVGEWLSPTLETKPIHSYNDIGHYFKTCLHIPFE